MATSRIVEAFGPLASRYLAVSRLADGERELYLDALIDETLADRAGARASRSPTLTGATLVPSPARTAPRRCRRSPPTPPPFTGVQTRTRARLAPPR